MSNRRREERKNKSRGVATLRKKEILLERPYIKITKVDLADRFWYSFPRIRDGHSNRMENRIDNYFSEESDILVNESIKLTPENIGKFRNIFNLYNSFMYAVFYIRFEKEFGEYYDSVEEEGKYVIYNKHKRVIYWRESDLKSIKKDIKDIEFKYKKRKTKERRDYNKSYGKTNSHYSKKHFHKQHTHNRKHQRW